MDVELILTCLCRVYPLKTYVGISSAGLIHIGDELKEVNGISVEEKKPEDIIKIMVCEKEKCVCRIAVCF